MNFRGLLLALILGTASVAHAAGGLEVARAEATQARERILGIRSQQSALRQELNQVAARIESLKTEGRSPLGPSGALDSSLKRSQELSSELTGIANALASAETRAESVNLSLHHALTEEMNRVRESIERTQNRDARRGLLSQLRKLRAEREGVRSQLPAARIPALSDSDSDDPEDLLEQADVLRDSEDKVRQRLQALRGRMQELRQERELDERITEFLGDDGLFDEQDRRLRLRRESLTQAAPGGGQVVVDSPAAEPENAAPIFSGDMASAPNAPQAGGVQAGRGQEGSAPTGVGAAAPPSLTVQRASDSHPNIGRVHGGSLASGSLVEMDLEQLELEEKRLEGLAKELDGRADQLEDRARDSE